MSELKENVLRKMKKQLIQAFSEGTKIEYDAEKKKLAIIKDRRKKLVDIYIDHVITKEEFKERCEILDKEISLMENKVRELEKFKTEKGLVENERDAIIKHIGKKEYIAEHQLSIEIITCFSRVLAYVVMLLMGLIANLTVFKILVVEDNKNLRKLMKDAEEHKITWVGRRGLLFLSNANAFR